MSLCMVILATAGSEVGLVAKSLRLRVSSSTYYILSAPANTLSVELRSLEVAVFLDTLRCNHKALILLMV